MVDEWGGEAETVQAIPDDYDALLNGVEDAGSKIRYVLVNAGSSAGSEDYTARVIEGLGKLVVHGTAIRPGHPVALGVVRGKPVLGIPGYPVSAALTCELFVKPLIERKLGISQSARDSVKATIIRKTHSPMGEDEFLRVRLGRVGEKLVASPVERGAGVIMSLVRADGIVRIPRFSEGLDAGSEVSVELIRTMEAIEDTVVVIGSHDMTLDLLASHVRRTRPQMTLASTNVGSMGGLAALSRGEAHFAGSHLLDEATGEYNLSFIHRFLKGRSVVLVNLVKRIQGLILPEANPRDVKTLEDLTSEELTFINRQRGSGTRLLLDYKLREYGIDPEDIRGYDREEYTHLAVAAAVAGGRADVGLGILSAAKAMGLHFVPLLSEQYDLVIPTEHYKSERVQYTLSIIRSSAFRKDVDSLGGYDTSMMGQVVAEIREALDAQRGVPVGSMGVSAIVLAGGLSRRLGRDKALEPFEGEPLIRRVIGRLSRITDETVVVVNSEARGSELPLPDDAVIAVDIFPDSGSLGGIFTGLTAAKNEWGFAVACDMPFLNTDLILHMLALRSGYDAVVPLLNGYPEPTHAAYSRGVHSTHPAPIRGKTTQDSRILRGCSC